MAAFEIDFDKPMYGLSCEINGELVQRCVNANSEKEAIENFFTGLTEQGLRIIMSSAVNIWPLAKVGE